MTSTRRIDELEAEVLALRTRLAECERDAKGNGAAFLAAVLEAVPAIIVRADANLRILYVNRDQHAVTRESALGTSVFDYANPSERERTRRYAEKVLTTGKGESFSTEGLGPEGTAVPYSVFLEPILEADGSRGICMVLFDVTTTRLRERALRESDSKLRLALDASGVALWSWSPRTGLVEWDDRMREITGRDTPLDLTAYIEQAVHPEDRRALVENSAPTLSSAGPWEAAIHRIVQPQGSVRWVMARGFNVVGDGGEIERVFGGTVDITEQRRLEERARHAQRLDAVGQLTAGVAHNFNNLLMVVTSNLELLARRASPTDGELIDQALHATVRAAELVRQLMTFAGQRPASKRRSNAIAALVQSAVEMCRRTFPRHISVACAIEDGLPPVLCSEGEIEQILMNLLLNARDAVLASGRQTPRISVRVDRKRSPGELMAAGSVRVEISDDGTGIAEDVLPRVFDPFFTTKPPGQGTGLGLATSYAIARELGGQLTCSSTLGAGATFELFLPATEHGTAEQPSAPSPSGGRGRVLVIDDEVAIRRAIVGLLENAGFLAEAEATGEGGLLRLAAGPPFDVVLLDRSMPSAPGERFIPRIRKVAPLSKIILFSGQLPDPAVSAKVDGVLAKPASASDLVAAITAVVPPRSPR